MGLWGGLGADHLDYSVTPLSELVANPVELADRLEPLALALGPRAQLGRRQLLVLLGISLCLRTRRLSQCIGE